MFDNLKSFIGSFAGAIHSKTAAFGGFIIKRKVGVRVRDGSVEAERRYNSVEEYTAYGNVELEFTAPLNDVRGVNKQVVEENGYVTPELFVSKLRATGAINREALIDVTADASNWIKDDSQIALLLSLLSTYYVQEYKEMKAVRGRGFCPEDYDDGHLSIKMANIKPTGVRYDDWRGDFDVNVIGWVEQMMTGAPNVPILNCRTLNEDELNLVISALRGRKKTTSLAFDLTIPHLAEEIRYSGIPMNIQLPPQNVKSKVVRRAIDKYVMVNRLYGQFEAALAMYHQVALNPLPDTAEGMAWFLRKKTLVVPSFDAFRGVNSVLMAEEPFGISATVKHSWQWWREAGLATAVPAAPYNAAALWGRYLVEAGYYDGRSEVADMLTTERAASPAAAHFAFASIITGGDVYCPLPNNLGLQMENWAALETYDIPVTVTDLMLTGYEVVTDGDKTALRLTNIPPPCSALFVLGRMPREGNFSALSDHYQIHIDRAADAWVLPSVNEAWGLGMVTRWLGYDAEMRYKGQRKIANWASNSSSIAVRPFDVSGKDIQTVDLMSVMPRGKQFDVLPSLSNGQTVWTVDVDVSDSYAIAGLRSHPVSMTGVFSDVKRAKDSIVVEARQSALYTPIVLRATNRGDYNLAGFHVEDAFTRHNPPDPIPLLTPSEAVDPGTDPPAANQ